MKFDIETLTTFGITYGVRIIVALLILLIGLKLISVLVNIVLKTLDNKRVDPSLKPFLSNLLTWILRICLFLVVANQVGIQTTSFIAVLGSVGLAVGLALQGSLSNFAGGVLILGLKPFKEGDVISTKGFVGTVDRINIFSTYLRQGDNQIVILPNGQLANSPITNINHEPKRRVDFLFGISYTDDISKAKLIIEKVIKEHPQSLEEPAPLIVVSELADSSVNLTVRVWVETPNYWTTKFALTEKVKIHFDQGGISIPFPQRDVHLTKPE